MNINAYAGIAGRRHLHTDRRFRRPDAHRRVAFVDLDHRHQQRRQRRHSAYVVTVVGNNLDLTVSPQLTWGGQTSGIWTNSPTNWYSRQHATAFTTQAVLFGDTQYSRRPASDDQRSVTVTSPVSPAAVTFNNNSVPYTIDTTRRPEQQGITGSTGMTLNGPAAGTLVGPNTYTGQTLLNSGSTLVISNVNSIGSTSAAADIQRRHVAVFRELDRNTDISTHTVTIAAGGATIDLNGNNVTYANSIGNNGAGDSEARTTAAPRLR